MLLLFHDIYIQPPWTEIVLYHMHGLVGVTLDCRVKIHAPRVYIFMIYNSYNAFKVVWILILKKNLSIKNLLKLYQFMKIRKLIPP